MDPANQSDLLYFLKGSDKPDHGDSPGISTVYSPDGSYVISAGDGTIVYGPNNGTAGKTTEQEPGKTLWPFGYVNKTTFFGSGDNQLYRATISGSKVKTVALLPEADGTVKEPTLSPDGKTIVFILEKDDSRALWTISTTPGSTPKKLPTAMDRTAQGTGILDWTTVQ
jgi:WD40 repeat protein